MITKKKICKSCNTEQYLFSRGRCQNCARKEDYKPIKKQTLKNKEYKKVNSSIRDEYFDYHQPLCKFSEESGSPIYNVWRGNICHIFPKRTYKSVQGDIENVVYLTNDEHTEFDRFLDTFDFKSLEEYFSCWPLVLERVKILLPRIKENGKLSIMFEKYLDL